MFLFKVGFLSDWSIPGLERQGNQCFINVIENVSFLLLLAIQKKIKMHSNLNEPPGCWKWLLTGLDLNLLSVFLS